MKLRVGNAENSKLNGEWGKHVKKEMKKLTSGRRRAKDKIITRVDLQLLLEP